MDDTQELEDLERAGWDALVQGGSAARELYDGLTADDVRMLLPGGLVLDDREVILQSMSDSPWTAYEMSDVRATVPAPGTGLVTYRVEAHRGEQRYSALMSSLYARRGEDWRLVFHQQTPHD